MKTYIINLRTSEERRKYVLKEVSRYVCMDVELVEAVDGRLLSPENREKFFDILKFAYRYGEFPLPGEIGCTLSHRECYRRLVESENEVALILEDDVVFLQPEAVEKTMNICSRILKKNGNGIISLSFPYRIASLGKNLGNGYSVYRAWKGFGTQAYLIHYNTAKKMLGITPSIRADDFLSMNLIGVKMYGVLPNFTTGLSFTRMASEVQSNKNDIVFCKKIPFKYKVRNLFEKIINIGIYGLHVFFRIEMCIVTFIQNKIR